MGSTGSWNHYGSAPIVKALLGKAGIPDDSPCTTGGTGLLGTKPSEKAMANSDTLLIVGSSIPYVDFSPKHRAPPGVAKAVSEVAQESTIISTDSGTVTTWIRRRLSRYLISPKCSSISR